MKSNEDVEWGVIFSEASGCLYHRRVFDQKEGGGGERDAGINTFYSFVH